MASVIKSYLVVSPLPVVVEEGGASISYQPGAVFEAKNTNPSVVRLLEQMAIIDVTGQSTDQGFAVIQGQIGPTGPTGAIGPIGPAGGLPPALAIDNTTGGLDIEITDLDNIVGESDGGWDLGSPDGGTTSLRPDTIFVKTSIVVGGTVTITASAVTGSAALLVISGADTDLSLTGADATPASGNDGGAVVLTAGAKDGAGVEGKLEFRGNYATPLVMDIDGAINAYVGINAYDALSVKVIEILADPGALRVGRNTQLTAAEGDFVFGNDGTLTGTQTGLLLWDASAQELGIRDNANLRMIDLDGASNEVAVYGATGIRGLKVAVNGGTAEFRAEDAADRTGVDTVLGVLVRGGNADGTDNGGALTLEAGRALGSGVDSRILFRTGNMDRWSIDLNGNVLASADNGYNIGAIGASRPLRVYVGTEVVVGNTITIGSASIDASGALALGGTTATSVALGRSGVTTDFLGITKWAPITYVGAAPVFAGELALLTAVGMSAYFTKGAANTFLAFRHSIGAGDATDFHMVMLS